MIHVIDLNFQTSHTIASFLIETTDGPVLVETGPHSCYPQLKAGIEAAGYQTGDIKHVFLTHIHFDHAGAAWDFARQGAKVYVHPVGYPHLLDPSRLYGSAKRIYGDMMEKLWGIMEPIAEDQLVSVEDKATFPIGEYTFTAHYTPGHANHHIAWQAGSVIFPGDVAGVKIQGGPVVPPCPPPDINLEKWYDSVELVRSLGPEKLYLTHFGEITNVGSHLDATKAILKDWGDWIRERWEAGQSPQEATPAFKAYTDQQLRDAGLSEDHVRQYEAANPAWMSVAGLMRYWRKKAEAENAAE